MHRTSFWAAVVLAIGFGCGLALPCVAQTADDCSAQWMTLRRAKAGQHWGQSRDAAKALLECVRADPSSEDWNIEDAERWLRDQLWVVELSPAEKRVVGRAERSAVKALEALQKEELIAAQEHLVAQLDAWKDLDGSESLQDPILARIWLVEIGRMTGDFDSAVRWVEGLLGLARSVYGPDHLVLASIHSARGRLMMDLGSDRWEKVEFELATALRIQEGRLDASAIEMALAQRDLGYFELSRQHTEAAEVWFERARSRILEHRGQDNVDYAKALRDLAVCAERRGDDVRAEELFVQAAQIWERLDNRGDSADPRRILRHLSQSAHRRGEFAKASEYQMRALGGAVDPSTSAVGIAPQVLEVLAERNRQEGFLARSDQLLREAGKIRRSEGSPIQFLNENRRVRLAMLRGDEEGAEDLLRTNQRGLERVSERRVQRSVRGLAARNISELALLSKKRGNSKRSRDAVRSARRSWIGEQASGSGLFDFLGQWESTPEGAERGSSGEPGAFLDLEVGLSGFSVGDRAMTEYERSDDFPPAALRSLPFQPPALAPSLHGIQAVTGSGGPMPSIPSLPTQPPGLPGSQQSKASESFDLGLPLQFSTIFLSASQFEQGLLGGGSASTAEEQEDNFFALLRTLSDRWELELGVARSKMGTGKHAEAEGLYRDLLKELRERVGEYHPYVIRALIGLADASRLRGDSQAARELLEEAANAWEIARLLITDRLARVTFLHSPYLPLARVALDLGNQMDAWHTLDLARGRSLEEQWQGVVGFGSAERDSLGRRMFELQTELAGGANTSNRRGEIRDEMESIAEGLRRRLGELSRAHDETLTDRAIVTWVSFELRGSDPEIWIAWKLPGGSPRFDAIAVGSEACAALRNRLELLRISVSSGRGADVDVLLQSARSIAPDLFGSARVGLLAAGSVLVIPADPVLGAPLQLILSRGNTASGGTILSYLPSMGLAHRLEMRIDPGNIPSLRALIVADPPFAPHHAAAMEIERNSGKTVDLPGRKLPEPTRDELRRSLRSDGSKLQSLHRLPYSGVERDGIRPLFSSDSVVLSGPEASELELREVAEESGLGQFDVLHFATHALVDAEAVGMSALVLSQVDLPTTLESITQGIDPVDGLITADEIVAEWKLRAHLVTLSACETGLGRKIPGEGYVGLANALMSAGAQQLLVSLWRVNDRATALFMEDFYQSWIREAMSPGAAMQHAREFVRSYETNGRRPFEHPYYWSAFILVGTGD